MSRVRDSDFWSLATVNDEACRGDITSPIAQRLDEDLVLSTWPGTVFLFVSFVSVALKTASQIMGTPIAPRDIWKASKCLGRALLFQSFLSGTSLY